MIAEGLLGDHFGSPPPNVGSLSDEAGNSKQRSLREELLAHRNKAECAVCHDRIDPFGFALEGFDLVGRPRTHGPAGPIDDSALTPDGESIDGLAGLKQYIVKHRREDFVRNLTERMLAFALGRPIDYRDEAAVRRILEQVKDNEFSARSLLRGISLSKPFRHRELSPQSVAAISRREKP